MNPFFYIGELCDWCSQTLVILCQLLSEFQKLQYAHADCSLAQSRLGQKLEFIYLCLLDRFPLSWLSVTQEKTSSWPILT